MSPRRRRASAEPAVAQVAALIGNPGRAAILCALLDARELSAGELAERAGLAANAASAHLAKLAAGGLLVARPAGRQRRYRLANASVGRALEALAVVSAPARVAGLDQATASARLRFARSCYDHLAGRLGVAVTEALAQRRIVVPASGRRYLVTDERALRQLFGVDARVLRNGKRSFARQCLDWSERRPHVAGALGAAILHALLEREYVARLPSTRALALSAAGERWFTLRLGLGPFEPVRR